jgi:hypothetical protein
MKDLEFADCPLNRDEETKRENRSTKQREEMQLTKRVGDVENLYRCCFLIGNSKNCT